MVLLNCKVKTKLLLLKTTLLLVKTGGQDSQKQTERVWSSFIFHLENCICIDGWKRRGRKWLW
jgi:hypothetical protein